jgi:hypothetical protein
MIASGNDEQKRYYQDPGGTRQIGEIAVIDSEYAWE